MERKEKRHLAADSHKIAEANPSAPHTHTSSSKSTSFPIRRQPNAFNALISATRDSGSGIRISDNRAAADDTAADGPTALAAAGRPGDKRRSAIRASDRPAPGESTAAVAEAAAGSASATAETHGIEYPQASSARQGLVWIEGWPVR